MKKRVQPYSVLMSIIAGLSINSAALAQDGKSKTEISKTSQWSLKDSEATTPINQTTFKASSWQDQEVALNGNDVVSYHKSDVPQKGSRLYAAKWDNTTWRFASEENRDLFIADPVKYIPEFGGYCPVALAKNNAKVGFSNQYSLVDEKLYLNFNSESRQEFRETPKEYVLRAKLNY